MKVYLLSDYQPIIVEPLPEQIAGYDSGGPRLIITHITNENFKSYAGVKTLGPFHKVWCLISSLPLIMLIHFAVMPDCFVHS